MILLDTDMLSIYQNPRSPVAATLRARIAMVPQDEEVGTTIVTYEEQTRGWFTFLANARSRTQQIEAYDRLLKHLLNWRRINTYPFDGAAADQYDHLASLRLRIGKSDLRIAAIALHHHALLLSRNLQHFCKVPGLRVEDWTKS
jgi:tRNA(fMet)-specific endonuclease VapC